MTAKELRDLVDQKAVGELRERMHGELEFGTAGLRGIVAAGSARMNLAVVRRATRALAEHLLSRMPDARTLPVVVGFDARIDSRRFADDATQVLLAAGIPVKRFADPVPTPIVAYAVRVFSAQAGIVITASHNPPEYNGYKLYLGNGVQVVAPDDAQIAQLMRELGPANQIPIEPHGLARADVIPDELFDRYLADTRAELPPVSADHGLRIAYTPLHGVGASYLQRAFEYFGYRNVEMVSAQREPDGHFPTVHFPNPEEPTALESVLQLARDVNADLVLANDPDVDRLAVAVPTPAGRWLALTGNQIGLLLADYLLERGQRSPGRQVISTFVSSPMLESIARAHGAHAERTLTGFKWLWTAALALENTQGRRFCFGYEEALGYSVIRAVRDKDGISAALAFAGLASEARARGQSVLERLQALYARHGLWASVQHSVVLTGTSGAGRIVDAMARLRAAPPSKIGEHTVVSSQDFAKPEREAPAWRGA
ncbi:MAG TPA: phospho-sugar mutase, partial [Polyangiaceae bacterium]